VPFSLLQLGAPWLTLFPYGDTYEGGEAVVQWVMVGSVAYGLLWPLGTVIVSLGRMWMAFWLIVLNTALFLGLGWVLVPKYGAAGYAAASSCSLILSNIPSVFFLYSKLGSVMRQFRWGLMVWFTGALTITCWAIGASGGKWLALVVGTAAATLFATWRVLAGPHGILFLLRRKPSQSVP
jgi:O-antigen/teichoic acid export membrane protein